MCRFSDKGSSMEHMKSINRSFHYSERLKSNLLLAMRALDRIGRLEGIELEGAIEVMRAVFEGLGTELGIAKSCIDSKEFNLAVAKVTEAEGHTDLHKFEKARQSLSEALSCITTLSGKSLSILKERDLV